MPDSANMLSNEWFSSIRTNTLVIGESGRTDASVRVNVSWVPDSARVTTCPPTAHSSWGWPELEMQAPPIHQLLVVP